MSKQTPTEAPKKDYTKLKQLLEEQETFPIRFTYKFIGRNTPVFATSVEVLERAFPTLAHEGTRGSANNQHLAKTYSFHATDADAIIEVFREIEKIRDLLIIL